jgi:predicted amidohydrolase YtcJ
VNGEAQEYAFFALLRTLVNLVAPRLQQTSLETIAREATSYGITSLQVLPHTYTPAGVDELLERPVPIRVRALDMPLMAAADWPRHAPLLPLVVRSGITFVADGTPVEHSMFVGTRYDDRPTSRGRLNFTPEALQSFLRRARAARQQPVLHASGDAAIDVVLDALEATGGEQWKALRPRIEHGYLLQERQFSRALRLGALVVQNPSHFQVPPFMRDRLGDRVGQWAPVRSIVAAGIPPALGSEGPLNPYLNMLLATTGTPHALTLQQALKAYTAGSAAAEFAEGEKGTIAPGKLADLAILSQNIFDVPTEALPRTVSVLTVVDGRVVHDALGNDSSECKPGGPCCVEPGCRCLCRADQIGVSRGDARHATSQEMRHTPAWTR